MINEVIEVKNYIDGKNINKTDLYRACFLLAKWYKGQGQSHADIRSSIFGWAAKHNIYIKYNVNKIIYKAAEDNHGLKDNTTVKISKKDVAEITSRFDSKPVKLTALAILCYAKAHADRECTFDISSVSLSAWLGINDSNLRNRYLKELVDFGYISKLSTPKNTYKWENPDVNCKYRLNVDIHNNGNITLTDNDIKGLYSELFC